MSPSFLIKHHKVAIIIALAICGLLILWPAYSYGEDRALDVSIQISEKGDLNEEIHIGEINEREFFITSLASPCYVRIKPAVQSQVNGLNGIYKHTDDSLWKQGEDGWWYFEEQLEESETIVFNTFFEITDDGFVNRPRNAKIQINETVVAEAIQAWGIDPDWTSQTPWNEVVDQPIVDTSIIGDVDGYPPNDSNQNLLKNGGLANTLYKQIGLLAKTSDDCFMIQNLLIFAVIAAFGFIIVSAKRKTKKRKEGLGRINGV